MKQRLPLPFLALALLLAGMAGRAESAVAVTVTDSSPGSFSKLREALLQGKEAPVLFISGEDQVGRLSGGATPWPGGEFVQVVPLEMDIPEAHFRNWTSSLPEALRKAGGFFLDNGVIRGKGGMSPVTVVPVTRAERWPKRPVLVVDAGFFPSLYKDEVRTPMIPLVLKLYSTLADADVEPSAVWIINRNRDPDSPLEFGYVPSLLIEIFSDPDRFREDLPEEWSVLDEAQRLTFFGQADDARRELETLMREGGVPYVYYQAAVIDFREGDVEWGIGHLRDAAKGDPDYSRGFLYHAALFWQRGALEVAETILRSGRELFPDNPLIATGIARLLIQRAVHSLEENPETARKLFEEAVSLPIPPDIREEIGKIWAETGAFQGPVAPPKLQQDPGRP